MVFGVGERGQVDQNSELLLLLLLFCIINKQTGLKT
jgi:hypothetical protein